LGKSSEGFRSDSVPVMNRPNVGSMYGQSSDCMPDLLVAKAACFDAYRFSMKRRIAHRTPRLLNSDKFCRILDVDIST
jgi:hypothetical protein